MSINIRKEDTVVVLAGKYKGRRGRVLQVYPKRDRILIEGVNMIKRHTKPSARNQQGGIVEREAAVHISNVMPWCEAVNGPSKIVMKTLEDGARVRVFKANGETLND